MGGGSSVLEGNQSLVSRRRYRVDGKIRDGVQIGEANEVFLGHPSVQIQSRHATFDDYID
jgi:hypothetical protein